PLPPGEGGHAKREPDRAKPEQRPGEGKHAESLSQPALTRRYRATLSRGERARPLAHRLVMETFLQQLINGISQGSAYALIALGYTMVYGVLRLINFAHSDVYMFGAFMGFYLANNSWIKVTLGASALSAILILLASMMISAVLGILIERFAYRPGRSSSRFALAFWFGI